MKKIYINPKMNVVVIKTQHMIADSLPQAGMSKEGTVNAESIGSRRYSLWDEDEEVEE